jgi:four helix bundle protein
LRRKHRDLRARQAAVDLVEGIYQVTAAFPREEAFGLTSQMRRAAVSVPANIAEGAARSSTRELLHFLSIASGSLSELDTHLEIAKRLKLIESPDKIAEEMDQVFALLNGLSASLKRKLQPQGAR